MKLAEAIALFFFTSGLGLSIAPATGNRVQDRDSASIRAKSAAASEADRQAARGERVFKENCSRCHDAPETLRPQITGQIIRHMRVRASLSAADEKALLRFLNHE